MTCPNCKKTITQWENSWGSGNAKCFLCNQEFRVVFDSLQGMHAIPAQEPRRGVWFKREDKFAPLGYGGPNGSK